MPSPFTWLRRIYSLDTLDTRFTSTAITPNTDTRSPAQNARANAIAQGASPSLWRTPEFFVYYIFFIVCVPLMFKTVIDASDGESPRKKTIATSKLLTGGQRQNPTHFTPNTQTFYHPVGFPDVWSYVFNLCASPIPRTRILLTVVLQCF
jgi:hypothetical protein